MRWTRVPRGDIDKATEAVWPTPNLRRHQLLNLVVFRGMGWLGPPRDLPSLRPVLVVTLGWDYLSLLAAIAPLTWVAMFVRGKRIQRHRRDRGLCLHCAYDLRAHAPGQLCPECGTPVPADLIQRPVP